MEQLIINRVFINLLVNIYRYWFNLDYKTWKSVYYVSFNINSRHKMIDKNQILYNIED